MADTKSLEIYLQSQQMDAALAADLAALHKPAVIFDIDLYDAKPDVPIGVSKLSGLPDLGPGQSWPVRPAYANLGEKLRRYDAVDAYTASLPAFMQRFENARTARSKARLGGAASLDFVVQFALADCWAAEPGLDPDLPREGLISLFYDVEEQPWGFDPADRPGFQVLYTDAGPDQLTRAAFPQDTQAWRVAEHEAGIAARADAKANQGFWSRLMGEDPTQDIWLPGLDPLPDPTLSVELAPKSQASMPDMMWRLKEISPELYKRVAASPLGSPVLDHIEFFEHRTQLGGWASPVQGHMMGLQAQLVSNGVYVGDADGYKTPQALALRDGASDWLMLAQIGSDEGAGMWGDSGMLYIWIRREDLRARNFEACWVILQSY